MIIMANIKEREGCELINLIRDLKHERRWCSGLMFYASRCLEVPTLGEGLRRIESLFT